MKLTTGVVRKVLPNGLTLLIQRNTSAPVVAVVTHVKAGYFDEPDEWVGIAHVLEHMFFKGTSIRGPGDIARDTQSLGGYLNAGTIYDKTVYFTVLPSGDNGLEKALDIQADALRNASIDAGELGQELEVIIQEAKRKLDSPGPVARETLYQLLFSRHRMRRWRIGTEEGLRKLNRADVRAYYESRYTPGNVVVGIVGDLDLAAALELAQDTYGDWDRPTMSIAGSPTEPDGSAADVKILTGDVMRPLVTIGWRTVGTLHADTPALDMTASLLGTGRGSRLYRSVRVPGLASTAQASHYTPGDVGVFDLTVAGEVDTIEEALLSCLNNVSVLGERGPTECELDRSRALMSTRWARMLESMDSRASALCEAEALGSYDLADELFQRGLAVSATEVSRVVREHLRPESVCGVFYFPEGDVTSYGTENWPPTPSRIEIEEVSRVTFQDAQLPEPNESVVGQSDHSGGITHRSYTGVDMLVKEKQGAGLVSIGIEIPGIPCQETTANAGISRLLVRASVRGAGGRSGEELAQAAELLGGSIHASSSSDGLGWGITVSPEYVREAASLLRLVCLEPSLVAKEVEKERRLQVSDARRARDDMFNYPIQKALSRAFQNDPYGLPVLGEPETVEAMTDSEVNEWAELVRSHRAVVVAVGDMNGEELLEALNPLADWPGALTKTTREDVTVTSGERASEDRDKAQSALALAFPAVSGASADRHAVTVLGNVLSGLAGRLFEELREKRSLAYTVIALPWLRRRGGAMLAYVATSPDRELEAREAMLSELARIVDEPVTEAEAYRASNYAAGLVEMRQQNASLIGSEILSAWCNETLDDLPKTAEHLRGVGIDDIRRVAKQSFGTGRWAEYVVRGTSKVS